MTNKVNTDTNSYAKHKSTNIKYHGFYEATVVDFMDGQASGRLLVFIHGVSRGSINEKNSTGTLFIASYCSPFMGFTSLDANDKLDKYEATQTSYGFWMIPPDKGNNVIVGFIDGNSANCFWIGVANQVATNTMIPGHAAGNAHTDAGKSDVIGIPVPQAETNKFDDKIAPYVPVTDGDSVDAKRLRPYSKYVTDGLTRQGLIEDNIRGVTTASARRNSPSEVYGISTPGPKIEGNDKKRKGGSTFVMDDHPNSEGIRLRTRSGAQLLIDETNGLVYMINRDGTAWFEMDAEGNIDMFSSKSITMRAEEDFNIRADRDIRMEAGQNIYMKAVGGFNSSGEHPAGDNGGSGGDIYIEARNDANILVKNNTLITNIDGTLDVDTTGAIKFTTDATIDIKSAGITKLDASSVGIKSSNLNVETGGNTQVSGTMTSDGNMYAPDFQAENIGLVGHTHIQGNGNDLGGGGETVPGTKGGGSGSASGPDADAAMPAVKVEPTDKTNIKYQDLGITYNAKNNNIKSAIDMLVNKVRESKIQTLLTRWTTREPCPEKKKD